MIYHNLFSSILSTYAHALLILIPIIHAPSYVSFLNHHAIPKYAITKHSKHESIHFSPDLEAPF